LNFGRPILALQRAGHPRDVQKNYSSVSKGGVIVANAIGRMCSLFTILFLIGTVQMCAQAPTELKVWSFQGARGQVQIKASQVGGSAGKKTCVLEIYSPGGANRSEVEEAEFLSTVLNDLPKIGVSVQSIDRILFRFNEPDAVARVAAYAASSKQWREALRNNNVSIAHALVTAFINESGAYREWDRVFREHGLALRVAGVEQFMVEPFSQAHASCPAGTDCKNLVVPNDAFVQMNVVPIARQ